MRRLVLFLLLVPWHAGGGEILESSIALDDARYRAFVRARIDAPPRAVYDTITDYPALPAVTPSIRSAEVLQVLGRGRHRIRTVTEACILIFCKNVRLVQDVEQREAWQLEAVTLPEVSDFKSSLARWRLLPVEGGTELHFTQVFEPDFWVPAVIGPWMIERLLVEEVRATTAYIERRFAGVPH